MQQNDEIYCFSYPINKFQTSVHPPVPLISNKIQIHTQILHERYKLFNNYNYNNNTNDNNNIKKIMTREELNEIVYL